MNETTQIKEVIEEIHSTCIRHVLNYLETGVFANKNAQAYSKAYGLVIDNSDVNDMDKTAHFHNYISDCNLDFLAPKIEAAQKLEGDELVRFVVETSSKHKILSYWLGRIFLYLVQI